jgi:hypothetical protein
MFEIDDSKPAIRELYNAVLQLPAQKIINDGRLKNNSISICFVIFFLEIKDITLF